MINSLDSESKLILNKDHSKISVYIHGDYDVKGKIYLGSKEVDPIAK